MFNHQKLMFLCSSVKINFPYLDFQSFSKIQMILNTQKHSKLFKRFKRFKCFQTIQNRVLTTAFGGAAGIQ